MGFVAYDSQVTAAIPLTGSAGRETAGKEIALVTYKDYTNAGAALEEAVGMFSNGEGVNRAVIMISNGEIVLETEAKTKASQAQFDSAVQAAAGRKIPIHIIGLGDEMDAPDVNIFKASEQTAGRVWRAGASDVLQNTLREILFDTLGVKKSAVGISTASGGMDTLQTNIPAAHATKAWILLTADGTLENVTAS